MTTSISPIPIFIIVHDRVTVLDRSVTSYINYIKTPIKIIFHDVASTYGPCLEYLEQKKKEGYDVYRSEINNHLSVMDTVRKYMNEHKDCEYFVLTDPDVELDNVNGDILEFFKYVSKKYNNKYVVGPVLRVDDLPDFYPRKKNVLERRAIHYRNRSTPSITYNNNTYKTICAEIDTTFQLVHVSLLSSKFPRGGYACYAPYQARHLDWYLDPNNLTDDQVYYSAHASPTAHWGRALEKNIHF